MCMYICMCVRYLIQVLFTGKPFPHLGRRDDWYGMFMLWNEKTVDTPKTQVSVLNLLICATLEILIPS